LEVLDIGNNFIRDFTDIEPLKFLLKLENLNLKGNPITRADGYKEKVLFPLRLSSFSSEKNSFFPFLYLR